MILPQKHISLSESYFGFGAFLLQIMDANTTIDSLWGKYKECLKSNKYDVKFSFDQYVDTLDYLFIIGAIEIDERGELVNAANKFNS